MITQRAKGISESLTLAITAKANKLKADGVPVVGFGAGEPDFNTPQYIIDAAIEAMEKGLTKYTPASGTLNLKKAICKKFAEDNGLFYEPSQIVVSNGAKHSLYNAIAALVEEGDEVIIPAPYWVTYPELVKFCGGTCVFVETGADFKLTPSMLKDAITPKTKALILNDPSNPTGAVYSKDELFALAKVVEQSGIYVISDEIYEKLVYGGEKHYSIATYSDAVKDHTIVINGVSKTYSMTGWRIGYLAAPVAIAKAISNVQSHMTSNPNTIAQYATEKALNGGKSAEDFIVDMHATFDARRKTMVARIAQIEGVCCCEPKGAFYVMIDVSGLFGKKFNDKTIDSAHVFAEALLDAEAVAVVPGEAFGAPRHVRLSYAISEADILEGLNRIDQFIAKLK